MTSRKPNSRGWSLPEAMILSVLLTVLFCALVVASSDHRRRSRLAASLDNLKFFGAGTSAYAADDAERYWAFTWRRGITYTDWIGPAQDDTAAAANQAVDIIRRLGPQLNLTGIPGWTAQPGYTHLMLLEYVGGGLAVPQVASPEDRVLLSWQRNYGDAYFELLNRPNGSGAMGLRWRYSSSYEWGQAFWARDSAIIVDGATQPTYSQGSTTVTWIAPASFVTSAVRNPRVDEVHFPSDKAHMWDRYQRHFGSQVLHFGYSDARIPVLMADGSASVRSTSSVNPGFRPAQPTHPDPTVASYQPDTNWEPPTRSGAASETLIMHLRFTRRGLRGRDFNGPEVFNP